MERRLKSGAIGVLLVAATVAAQVKVLHLRGRDLDVPYVYTGDALTAGISIKTMIETGWYFDNPSLGLPGALNTRDYPGDDLAHLLALRILAFFTHSWGAVMNLYFILGCSLTALFA